MAVHRLYKPSEAVARLGLKPEDIIITHMHSASDDLYFYENLDKHVAIAATLDAESNLHAQDRMKELAADPRLIILRVMRTFPQVALGVVKIQ